MKIVIDNYHQENVDCDPIEIKELELYTNDKGQVVVAFRCNYKYLDIDNSASSCNWDENGDTENFKYNSRCIDIRTYEKFNDDEDDIAISKRTTTLLLVPESEEEYELIDGYIHVLPLKYEYRILFIQSGDHGRPENDEPFFIEEGVLQSDKVYQIDMVE